MEDNASKTMMTKKVIAR